ncbi:MAG: uncharacterized protein KVP18_004742 [Porospora cf. gigantea A]|uniref:uncharacterized protein n=1 Tax=Porospora cf. gigantea A TaxID=2853593 RepID=UPI003559F2DD|nr:MAG: hypothetical protein KVP18_004742 [Porospora cf. gigantea A]
MVVTRSLSYRQPLQSLEIPGGAISVGSAVRCVCADDTWVATVTAVERSMEDDDTSEDWVLLEWFLRPSELVNEAKSENQSVHLNLLEEFEQATAPREVVGLVGGVGEWKRAKDIVGIAHVIGLEAWKNLDDDQKALPENFYYRTSYDCTTKKLSPPLQRNFLEPNSEYLTWCEARGFDPRKLSDTDMDSLPRWLPRFPTPERLAYACRLCGFLYPTPGGEWDVNFSLTGGEFSMLTNCQDCKNLGISKSILGPIELEKRGIVARVTFGDIAAFGQRSAVQRSSVRRAARKRQRTEDFSDDSYEPDEIDEDPEDMELPEDPPLKKRKHDDKSPDSELGFPLDRPPQRRNDRLLSQLSGIFAKGLQQVLVTDVDEAYRGPDGAETLAVRIVNALDDVQAATGDRVALLQNLRREDNAELRSKILSSQLRVSELVRMNSSELAPGFLRDRRKHDQEKYFKTNVIVPDGPNKVIRKTHKGIEEVGRSEVLSPSTPRESRATSPSTSVSSEDESNDVLLQHEDSESESVVSVPDPASLPVPDSEDVTKLRTLLGGIPTLQGSRYSVDTSFADSSDLMFDLSPITGDFVLNRINEYMDALENTFGAGTRSHTLVSVAANRIRATANEQTACLSNMDAC